MSTRYDQCDDTCTVDCGHCKGAGIPAHITDRLIESHQEQTRDMALAYIELYERAERDPGLSYALGRFLENRWDTYSHAERIVNGEGES